MKLILELASLFIVFHVSITKCMFRMIIAVLGKCIMIISYSNASWHANRLIVYKDLFSHIEFMKAYLYYRVKDFRLKMCSVLVYRISFRYCSENWRRVSASERNAKKRRQPTRCQMAHLWVPKFGTHLFSPVVYRQHPRKIFIIFTAILNFVREPIKICWSSHSEILHSWSGINYLFKFISILSFILTLQPWNRCEIVWKFYLECCLYTI